MTEQKNQTNILLSRLLDILIDLQNKTNSIIGAEYLSTKQAARYLNFSRQQLEIWRCNGGGPLYTKLAHAVRYKISDLDDFMRKRVVSSTSEAEND